MQNGKVVTGMQDPKLPKRMFQQCGRSPLRPPAEERGRKSENPPVRDFPTIAADRPAGSRFGSHSLS